LARARPGRRPPRHGFVERHQRREVGSRRDCSAARAPGRVAGCRRRSRARDAAGMVRQPRRAPGRRAPLWRGRRARRPRASHGREYLRGGLAVLVRGREWQRHRRPRSRPGPRGRAVRERLRIARCRAAYRADRDGHGHRFARGLRLRDADALEARAGAGRCRRRGDARRGLLPGQRARRPGGAQPGDPARRPPTGRGRRAPDLRAVSMKLATVPNIICLLRMALTVPIVVLLAEGRFGQTLALFAVAAASDVLDGYLAKTFGWTSEVGKVLDPLADKLLLVSVFITLAAIGLVPVWLAFIAVLRDVVIGVGAGIYKWLFGPLEGRPTIPSKLNTL